MTTTTTDTTDLDRLRAQGVHTLVLGMDGEGSQYVALDDYLNLEDLFFEYRKALALINAYHWQGDLSHKIRVVLNNLGFKGEEARAMLALLHEVRSGRLK